MVSKLMGPGFDSTVDRNILGLMLDRCFNPHSMGDLVVMIQTCWTGSPAIKSSLIKFWLLHWKKDLKMFRLWDNFALTKILGQKTISIGMVSRENSQNVTTFYAQVLQEPCIKIYSTSQVTTKVIFLSYLIIFALIT